jgi:CP family cyanate transporter-like MFS transporter
MIVTPGPWILAWIALHGFANATCLILALGLPPLVSPRHDVHRVSAGMFAMSYSLAVTIPILGGLAWDATGSPPLALLPVGACGLAVALLGSLLKLARYRQ